MAAITQKVIEIFKISKDMFPYKKVMNFSRNLPNFCFWLYIENGSRCQNTVFANQTFMKFQLRRLESYFFLYLACKYEKQEKSRILGHPVHRKLVVLELFWFFESTNFVLYCMRRVPNISVFLKILPVKME